MSAQKVATFFFKIEKWNALYFYTCVPTQKVTTKLMQVSKERLQLFVFHNKIKKTVDLKIKIEFSASHKTSGKS